MYSAAVVCKLSKTPKYVVAREEIKNKKDRKESKQAMQYKKYIYIYIKTKNETFQNILLFSVPHSPPVLTRNCPDTQAGKYPMR